MTKAEIKQSILDTADHNGEIRFGCSPPLEARELVKEGRIVRISYLVYSLPEGG